MLDDHLFKLDMVNWTVRLSTPKGRIEFKLLHGKYHEKFKDWRIGQAWLVKRDDGIYFNVVFSKSIEIKEPKDFVSVDINENNVTILLPNNEFVQIITHEKEIRTAYFLKRRKIQRKIKTGKRRKKLLKKYGKREKNRITDLYHKLANEIVEIAEKFGGMALENLKNIRRRVKHSRELNGRLHRWSFRKLQSIIEYKAKLKGLIVIYVDPKNTSSLCPICGGNLSPKEQRISKCKCGLETDRDIIGSWNIRLKALKMWGVPVPPESQSMKPETGRLPLQMLQNYKSSGESERVVN